MMSLFVKTRVFIFVCCTLLLFALPLEAQNSDVEDCILIIGDSIPAGHSVSEVPGFGFPVIVSEPFSRVLDRLYNELNFTHMGIYNLAVGASSLGTGGDVRYENTSQYAYALSKRCQFAVIFPFINDLPQSADMNAANSHVEALAQLTFNIHVSSPQTRVVILDYYRVVVTELGGRVYGNSISPAVIGTMNQALAAGCATSGLLGAQPNTSCFHIEPYLLPLDANLMMSITPSQFRAENFRAYDAQGQGWLNEFWAANPTSPINIDGVHLNAIGKRRLAVALQNHLQAINPIAFQTVAPF